MSSAERTDAARWYAEMYPALSSTPEWVIVDTTTGMKRLAFDLGALRPGRVISVEGDPSQVVRYSGELEMLMPSAIVVTKP